ncbi:hypothetical protein L4X63_12600 [Geomonas sp. Red32]|uniref:hypothetical protein n=1 Tax=Geomonas sp. Red32 TaxID=2912856 RepID=UPI00202D0C02|nr:hypothetical protein [Geomonas sp. Red32]MCM0082430.1 hypothetical protein [Geomonas sp. Red32]
MKAAPELDERFARYVGNGERKGAGATSPRIMLIRHAEKPAGEGPPYGVDGEGNREEDSITPLGWQRAGALVVLFAPAHGALQGPGLSPPQYLFACGKEKERTRLRPLQTVVPLAKRLLLGGDE